MKKLLIYALILAIVALPLTPAPAYALTDTLVVTGEGAETNGNYAWGPPLNFNALNSDDDLTTAIALNDPTGDGYHCYNVTDFGSAFSSVTSVVMTYKVKYLTASVQIRPYVRIAGVNYYPIALFTAGAVWTTYTQTWNVSPATGVGWTDAELDAAQFGLHFNRNASGNVAWTYMKVDVNYVNISAPALTTVAASSVSTVVATLNGNISDNGTDAIDHRGFTYDTVTRAAPGNVAPAAAGYASWWTDNSTAFALGAFSHITGGLTANTDYYFRAFAHNSAGWTYGNELTFHTVGNPTISLLAASNVATTTARLNSQVTNANGQPCDVRFGWDVVTRANVAAYANVTAWVNDTYNTGDFPFVDIIGLTATTPYFFRVEIKNDAGSAESGELTFTTYSGIAKPTNLQVVPSSTSINLSWIKGSGSSRTLVRYSTGTYPNGTGVGSLAYLNTGNTVTITGLTAGTSVFISAWGENGGVYSAGWSTVLATTIPYSSMTGGTVPTPPANNWMQAPDASGVSTVPLVPGLIQANATAYGIPLNMLWYFLWSFMAIAGGIITFRISDGKLAIAVAVTAILFGAGASIGLTMLVIVALFLLIAAGFIFFGDRRN
jgi:hypothetical protein